MLFTSLNKCMTNLYVRLIIKENSIILSYSLLDTQSIVSEYDIDYVNANIKWYTE